MARETPIPAATARPAQSRPRTTPHRTAAAVEARYAGNGLATFRTAVSRCPQWPTWAAGVIGVLVLIPWAGSIAFAAGGVRAAVTSVLLTRGPADGTPIAGETAGTARR